MFSIDAILWDHIAWAIQPFFLGIFANRIWILVWYSLAMPSIGVEHKKTLLNHGIAGETGSHGKQHHDHWRGVTCSAFGFDFIGSNSDP